MRAAVIGLGAVGARAARQLASTPTVDQVVLRDLDQTRLDEVARSLGATSTVETGRIDDPVEADAVVVATPSGRHVDVVRGLVERGIGVVSTSDSVADVRALLDLGPEADVRGVTVAEGAAF